MTNPVVRAFFIGRATADLLRERVEYALTDFASMVGKGLAEFQESWQAFPEDVMARADQEQSQVSEDTGDFSFGNHDLQATLDDLRAEVAHLRSELQKYRSQST